MSGLINKVKEVLHHDNTSTTTGTTTGVSHDHAGHTHGPHNTDTLNEVDPRVDSDLDGSRTVGNNNTTGFGNTGAAEATYGTTGTGITGTGTTTEHHHHHHHHHHDGAATGAETHHNRHETGQTTAGPHSSNTANRLDPAVDSDLDGSRTVGTGANTYGSSTGTGVGANNANYNSGSTGTSAPPVHSSKLLNKLDPRVPTDSTSAGTNMNGQGQFHKDIDSLDSTSGSGLTGTTGNTHYNTTTGTTGNTSGYDNSSTGAGPHSSSLANKLDPRVDSTTGMTNTTGAGYSNTGYNNTTAGGYDNTSGTGANYTHSTTGAGTGPGYASGTGPGYTSSTNTGPGPVHNSALANKLDPRVDSNVVNSNQVTGNY